MTGRAIGPLLLALALFAGQAVWLAPAVERSRVETKLEYVPAAGLEIPADIQLLQTALGSFRGWLINILWLRAGQLESEDRIHESMQLSRWITRLQPHFPRVWSHQAWNLAFNLSVSASAPEERWMWIESGIDLLRDEGIPINRESWELYQQLSYIFWFKLGDESRDELRPYYWRRFAAEWDQVLGPPQGETAEERAAWLAPVVDAPLDRDAVYARFPGLAPGREDFESAIADAQDGFLSQVSRAERGSGPLVDWLSDPELGEARRALVAQVRSGYLRERYRMQPRTMRELTLEFGPIDWRHPAAHAVYWSAVGVLRIETGEPHPSLTVDLLPTLYRNHSFAIGLQQLVRGGRLGGDPVTGELRKEPEWRFISAYEQTIFDGGDPVTSEVPELFRGSYWRILESGLENAWLQDESAVADRCLAQLRRHYDETASGPREWVLSRLSGDLPEDPEEADAEVADRIRDQFFSLLRDGWGAGNDTVAERRRELAETLHARFSLAGARMPALDVLESETVDLFLGAQPWIASAAAKATVWDRLSPERRAAVPDDVLARLRDEARRIGLDPEAAFPRSP